MSNCSISPSSSIRSHSSDGSDSGIETGNSSNSRYAGLSEDELMRIWERRDLAYYNRRQRLSRQQQGQEEEEDPSGERSMSNSSGGEQEISVPREFSASLSSVQREQLQQQQRQQQQQQQQQQPPPQQPLVRPADYDGAADEGWRRIASSNIMGEYNPERAMREPAYHTAWMSCQRLVNMSRSDVDPNDFIPSNPRLAALMESRRREIAQERFLEEGQEGNSSLHHGGAAGPQVPPSLRNEALINQLNEYERLNEAHRSQHLSGSSTRLDGSSSENSSGKRKKNGQNQSYYMALPYSTQQLTKPVTCTNCNCALYTNAVATRFFCQTCGIISNIPRRDAEASYEEKMQDVEDQDVAMSC